MLHHANLPKVVDAKRAVRQLFNALAWREAMRGRLVLFNDDAVKMRYDRRWSDPHTHVDLADDALLQKAGHGFAAVPHMIMAANLEMLKKSAGRAA